MSQCIRQVEDTKSIQASQVIYVEQGIVNGKCNWILWKNQYEKRLEKITHLPAQKV
jgi:homoserine dehydrogenase